MRANLKSRFICLIFFFFFLIFNLQIPSLVSLLLHTLLRGDFKPFSFEKQSSAWVYCPFPSAASGWVLFSFALIIPKFCWSQLHGSAPLELPQTPGGIFIAPGGFAQIVHHLILQEGLEFSIQPHILKPKSVSKSACSKSFTDWKSTPKSLFSPLHFPCPNAPP